MISDFARKHLPKAPTNPARLLLFGGRGYLGQYVQQLYPGANTSDADIADAVAVRRAIESSTPEVVVNCAGRCGLPNVDWCEEHKRETLHSNVTGALVLCEECDRAGVYLVHMGSGCIYSGDNGGAGFAEDDPPNFSGSFYSRTKTWADHILQEFPVLILRLRMPFDGSTSDRNLLMKLRRYSRVLTEPNSLTYLPDFLTALKLLVQRRAVGAFNVVNPGAISPFEVMGKYRELVDPSHQFAPLPPAQLREVARAGRSSCLLDTAKLQGEGITLLPIEKALEKALIELKTNLTRDQK